VENYGKLIADDRAIILTQPRPSRLQRQPSKHLKRLTMQVYIS